MSWNEDLFSFINQDMANPGLDVFFAILIILGTVYVWLVFVPALWWKGKKNEAVDLFFLILLVLVVTTVLKFLFAAPRPEDIREVPIPIPGYFAYDVYSFPSNHASRAFACALFLSFRFKKWTVPLFVYAFSIGLAKIYVGAHYPGDVIGGALVGIIVSLPFIWLVEAPSYARYRDKMIKTIHWINGRVGSASVERRRLSREFYEELLSFDIHAPPEIEFEDDEASEFMLEIYCEDPSTIGPDLVDYVRYQVPGSDERMLSLMKEWRTKLNALIEKNGERPDLMFIKAYLDHVDDLIKRAQSIVE